MAKSLDKVLQSDGSYKWELVEISSVKSNTPVKEEKKKPTSKKTTTTTKE